MKRRIEYDRITTKQILNRVTSPSMPFEWSINPYRGCQHGCSFCYARAFHSFLGMDYDDTFQNHILIKENAAASLEAQLAKMAKSKGGLKQIGRIAIGTATDPYQPAEAAEKLTRQCLEVLVRYPVPLTITTRSPLVLRDLDLLKRLPVLSVNFSLQTMNTEVWKAMEPSTPSPAKRLEAVQALTQAGIPVGVFMAPILPRLTDREADLRAVMEKAAEASVSFVMASYLRLTPDVKVWFFRNLEEKYPHLVPLYAELYQASAYLPRAYKEPKDALIRSLLKEYRLNDTDRDSRFFGSMTASKGITGQHGTASTTEGTSFEPEPEPVQLSFTFA